jgi:abortive infection bacteriophage resistance protein
VTFNEIVALYHFDEQLRSLFLKYILQVERHLKSLISFYFCNKYGVSQTEYLNPNNFDYGIRNYPFPSEMAYINVEKKTCLQ